MSSRDEQLIADEPAVPLFEANVESRESALDFLADATRFAPDRGMIRVSGIELDIRHLAKVLGVCGPPPARIVVKVPAP